MRAGLAGDHLRAITRPGTSGDGLLRALTERGFHVSRVAEITPALEDVFLYLAVD
jgi:hypothetical protein